MNLLADLMWTIKRIAMEAVRASKPADYVVGTVSNLSPFTIQLNQKQEYTGSFLVFTRLASRRKWQVGDKAILLQKQGAQEFLVIDKGGQL